MKGNPVVFGLLFICFMIYSFFVYTVGTVPQPDYKITDEMIKGKLLFQQHNCIACHQIYGLGGFLGPELTTVISQPGKGENYAKAFIANGTAGMPDFKLNNEEVISIVTYLKYVDTTAVTYKQISSLK